MSKKPQMKGFSVSGDKPKPQDLKPTNVNPPTPEKPPNKNQENS
ncbi:hypothetical protein [Calothrix sp. UHCC 0171]|nr:hypothetical protein [Calothrix sp. UHCC 0171]MEA5574076.1 hypothetical protein [Calothrix sp. UHCC 0171]